MTPRWRPAPSPRKSRQVSSSVRLTRARPRRAVKRMRKPDSAESDRGAPAGRLVFGIQPVREAVRAHGARITQVAIEAGDHPQLQALARFARDQGIDVATLSRAELDRRAKGA